MTITEMSGQTGILVLLGIGVVIVLLIYLIKRVSALAKIIDDFHNLIKATETNKVVYVPVKETASVEAVSAAVPNAVVAAISAALNQYRIDNT